jgi:glucose/arabinose dehydrogenase
MKTLDVCATVALIALATVTARSQSAATIASIPFISGLQSPVAFVADPGDRSVFYAVEQAGRIRVVRNRALAEDLLDLRTAIAAGGERGLLGLALAPDFPASRRFFVNFTNLNGHTVVARFRKGANGTADMASRFDLRLDEGGPGIVVQPYSNHNGGHLAFGPDGMLYIGLGDGGSGNDPEHRAQNVTTLLGKMLRINVGVADGHATGYDVPANNPFGKPGGPLPNARPEIWSLGLRNPWRYSFDIGPGGTGALVIGDVGQNQFEEIDYEPTGRGGRNYGWRNREGAHNNVVSLPVASQPLIDPIHEYAHPVGVSVTGGAVYRGSSLQERNRGRYFFADYSGKVWSLGLALDGAGEARVSDVIEHTAELGGSGVLGTISAFGTDLDGELYIVSHSRGVVLRLAGVPPAPQNLHIVR